MLASTAMENVIDQLKSRGLLEAVTSEEIAELTKNPIKLYCGFDPTSDSLHLGNLVMIVALAHFLRCGHTPMALVGGATARIGDPSGRSKERPILSEEQIQNNVKGIHAILSRLLRGAPAVVNNNDWIGQISLVEFLRDTGKLFRVGPMIGKEMVRSRLQSDEGLSYTEFSYQLIQAYDFLHLHENDGVVLQIGGKDQWGNITAGVELVRKKLSKTVFGLTCPLLLKSDGTKFGKTAEGAIWLSPERLSPYKFYQYLYSVADSDVIKLLKMLTFVDLKVIADLEEGIVSGKGQANSAQELLAKELTRFVHGEEGLESALRATEAARPGRDTALDAERLESIAADMPSQSLRLDKVVGASLIGLVVEVGMRSSKSEVRRLVRSGGVYLNNQKVSDEALVLGSEHLIEGKLLLLGLGKKSKMLIRILSPSA